MLVARTSYYGLRAAQLALTDWAAGSFGEDVELVGLVLIPDAPGGLPKALRHDEVVVAGGAPRTWRMPWVEGWRTKPATAESMPKQYSQLLTELSLSPTSNPAHH